MVYLQIIRYDVNTLRYNAIRYDNEGAVHRLVAFCMESLFGFCVIFGWEGDWMLR